MENLLSIGIYRITSPSGKSYVGLTGESFKARWASHKRRLKAKTHRNSGLQRACEKYGIENLRFEILESWFPSDKASDESMLLVKEVFWWEKLDSAGVILYNARPTGTGSVFHSEETKKKIGKAGTKPPKLRTCECCQKEFEQPKKKSGVQRFCSRECVNKRTHDLGLFKGNPGLRSSETKERISSAMIGNKNGKASASKAGKQSAHNRWHKERKSPNCEMCN